MSVASITKSQFDSLQLPDSCRALWSRSEEIEWYANPAKTVFGVVLASSEKGYWDYVICAREGGEDKRLGVGHDFTSLRMARNDLLAGMVRHAASGVGHSRTQPNYRS